MLTLCMTELSGHVLPSAGIGLGLGHDGHASDMGYGSQGFTAETIGRQFREVREGSDFRCRETLS